MNVDFGVPVFIYMQYSPANFLFSLTFNEEELEPYNIPDGTPDIHFKTVSVMGDIIVNFIGFGEPGFHPAVPTGTRITYGCPDGLKFESDWYRLPRVTVECDSNGLILPPQNWEHCIDRESQKSDPC